MLTVVLLLTCASVVAQEGMYYQYNPAAMRREVDRLTRQIAGTVATNVAGASGTNWALYPAQQTINAKTNWLSGDGDAEGVFVDGSGNVTLSGSLTVPGGGNVLTNGMAWPSFPSNVLVRNTSGVVSNYANFRLACAALQNNDTLFVYSPYATTVPIRITNGLSNVDIIGIGNPIIGNITDLWDADESAAFWWQFSTNCSLEGIRFCNTTINRGGSSHIYGWIFSGATNLTIRNCSFQYEVTGSANVSGAYLANNLVSAPSANVLFDKCNVITHDTTGSNFVYHMAMHNAGLTNILFRDCVFVGKNMKGWGQIGNGNVDLLNCAGNTNSLTGNAATPTIYSSYSVLPYGEFINLVVTNRASFAPSDGMPAGVNIPSSVGIGTNATAATLHVAGPIICTTNFLYYVNATSWVAQTATVNYLLTVRNSNSVITVITNTWAP
jgi:hypothetical protein